MSLSKEFYEFLNSLREDLGIDRDNLDRECTLQPQLYEKIGHEVVLSGRLAKDAKVLWDEKEAEVQLAIRKNPSAYGLEKCTESTVAAALTLDDSVKKFKRGYLQADEEHQALKILLEAMSQRKSMIRDIVDLFVHNYYTVQSLSTPSGRIQEGNKVSVEENKQFEEGIAAARKLRKEQRSTNKET